MWRFAKVRDEFGHVSPDTVGIVIECVPRCGRAAHLLQRGHDQLAAANTPSQSTGLAKEEDIARLPENLADTLITVTFDAPGDSVLLSADWSDGYRPLPSGLYIDWIEVARR